MTLDRRKFLKMLGIAGLTAAAPKFIFDMGANLYKPKSIWDGVIITQWDNLPPADTYFQNRLYVNRRESLMFMYSEEAINKVRDSLLSPQSSSLLD